VSDSQHFDYVIVGAGSAGCAVANRLSADASVLLLELGGADVHPDVHEPGRVLHVVFLAPDISHPYLTEPQPGLNGRPVAVHRGVVRGGCSSINAMVYIRGNRRDYDSWAQSGNEGWSYQEVLPCFKRSEDFEAGPSEYHGTGGPLRVRRFPEPSAAAKAFVAAAAGFQEFRGSGADWDFNGARQENAAGFYQVNFTALGRRASAAVAFLDPVKTRESLVVKTGVRARRILVERDRAVGVECEENGARRTYRADREIVVSAGAFESPKLLMLSGIGPAAHLEEHGIPIVTDLPGVGQNLQDHLMVLMYFLSGQNPGRALINGEAGLFVNTRDRSGVASPDLQYHVLAGMDLLPVAEPNFLICPTLCKPDSRGYVALRSAAPADAPIVQPRYLDCQSDVDTLVNGIELGMDLANARPLADFCSDGAPFAVPNPFQPENRMPVPRAGRQALNEFVRTNATTVWHPVGTCRMGRDRMAVVDPQLRVYGIDGLRVADASVMPTIPSGNTNAPAIMIGERAADLIRGAFPQRGL
jgi:choline dehydrogenase-like flavoprotein